MRRFIRSLTRIGRDSDVWPIVLLLIAVLAPAASLLWFVNNAMRNERFATRQALTDAYQLQLFSSRERLKAHLKQLLTELENAGRKNPASAAFAACVRSGLADSVVILDEQGRIAYPNPPAAPASATGEAEARWAEASQIEHGRRDFLAAAKAYAALANGLANVHAKARALQAQARCLVRAGQTNTAVELVIETFADDKYNRAIDPQGRVIAANAELMALELIADKASNPFQSTARRLKQRLDDYEDPVLAAPQRRFLMKALRELSGAEFPTLRAEELAARFRSSTAPPKAILSPGPGAATWQMATPDGRVVAFFSSDALVRRLEAESFTDNTSPDVQIALEPPGAEAAAALVAIPAADILPGWRLTAALKDPAGLEALTRHRSLVHFWLVMLLLVGIGMLTLFAVRLMRRQAALARLKNDLAATVSHELRAPLSSMRVLVDTLLDSRELSEHTTREYLQLIARENERLSRLIQNFLAFSRIERNKQPFHFGTTSPGEIIDAAVSAMGERFQTPGCRFELRIEHNLPMLMADRDALITALINLLDNAWKFSGDIKHIIVTARAERGKVLLSIQDNGVGIPPRETARIFESFYQVDQRLSRSQGGCGLGLSIVRFIATAHKGNVSVDSQPGRGSTFTMSLPIAETPVLLDKEAIA